MIKNKKLNILSIIAMIMAFIGIGVFTYFSNQEQDIRRSAAPSTSINILPITQNKNLNENFTFNVVLNTDVNRVTGYDVVIRFDPQKFNINTVLKGADVNSSFTDFNKNIDNTIGKITYSAFSTDTNQALSGNVTILVISGTVNANSALGSSNFTFDENTVASAVGEGRDVLISKTAGSINVLSLSSTASPVVTATATAMSTVSPTSTATATTTSRSTATATATTTAMPTNNSGSVVMVTPVPIPVTGKPTITLFAGILSISAVIFGILLISL